MTADPAAAGGFWHRLAALLFDLVVTCFLGVIVWSFSSFGVAFLATIVSGEKTPGASAMTVGVAALFAVDWLYFALMESSARGATLGKRLFGLRVVTGQGARLSFARASGRFFARFVSAAPVGIGFVMAAFTGRGRALHDMIAGTLVVKT